MYNVVRRVGARLLSRFSVPRLILSNNFSYKRSNLFSRCLGFGLGMGGFLVISCADETISASDVVALKDLTKFDNFKPKEEGFERIDPTLQSSLSKYFKNNAMHDTLQEKDLIETYQVYFNTNTQEIYCVIHFGNRLNGHPGIVHGGITALAFDNTFGWLFFSLKTPPAFTANLSVNYR